MEVEAYPIVHRVERTHWFFVARRRIVASFVDKYFPRSEHSRTLDIGGGTGGLVDVLKPYGALVGMDYSGDALSYYRQHHPVVCQGDAVHLPFKSCSLDFVMALDVLEHLQDDGAGLSEFFRVLRAGGRALVTVPAFKFLWGRLDDLGRHKRRYRLSELGKKATSAGFGLLKVSYFNTFLFPVVLFSRRMEFLRKSEMTADEDLNVPHPLLNSALINLFGMEAKLLHHVSFPVGVSIVCILEKTR